MPAPFDYPRIISEADAPREAVDSDALSAQARARRTQTRRRWFRLPGWLTEIRRAPGDGLSMPALRDYPYRSSDGA